MKFLIFSVLLILLAGCVQAPLRDWEQNSAAALERYRQSLLVGDTSAAAGDFREALREAKRGGEVSLLAKVHLTQCALRQALLEFATCPDYRALAPLDQSALHQAYFDWLQAAPADARLLPVAYRELAARLQNPDAFDIATIIQRIDEPLARLIACATVVRAGREDAAVLHLATDTAARQGWKSAHLAFRRRLADYLEKTGRLQEARQERLLNEVLK